MKTAPAGKAHGLEQELFKYEKANDGVKQAFISGATYSGQPLAAAIADKFLEICERNRIIDYVVKMGEYARKRLEQQFLPLPNVGEVRGNGQMQEFLYGVLSDVLEH